MKIVALQNLKPERYEILKKDLKGVLECNERRGLFAGNRKNVGANSMRLVRIWFLSSSSLLD